MQSCFRYAASDAALNGANGPSSAFTTVRPRRRADGIDVRLGVRPCGLSRVRLEQDTGADTPDCLSVHVSAGERAGRRFLTEPSLGFPVGGNRYSGGGHD